MGHDDYHWVNCGEISEPYTIINAMDRALGVNAPPDALNTDVDPNR